ncbi:beta-propeller domain-containing protein [Paenibacillus sp. GP183]|uniref:beta-propeller domain-containing protein n=1 Tax=Paenibacillus sp. GP183 TaxID=1882751 RepID=UPI0008980858|nr:beta-propeller domain-containing protein [Paenibacillus sp. GP183]SEB77663.1 Secreted protein containing C-terminal beta-propeller domain [Paenibacillus sp. GP183]
MKKMALLGGLILAVFALFTTGSLAGSNDAAAKVTTGTGPIPIEFAGKQLTFTTVPQNMDNHLMVPLREMSDMLGIQVQWNEQTGEIASKKDGRSLIWNLGQAEAQSSIGKLSLAEAPYLADESLMVPLRNFSEAFGFIVHWDESRKALVLQKEESNLPIVGSAAKLSALLEESQINGNMQYSMNNRNVMKSAGAASTGAVPATAQSSAAAAIESKADTSSGYSTTNVQVAGVDEADIVKTDGSYIYQVNRDKVIVSQAVPADKMKIVSTLSFSDGAMQPTELYVDSKYLIVIGNTAGNRAISFPAAKPMDSKMIMPIRPNFKTTVKAIIYDLTDKANLKKLREVELDGYYVSSRKINDSLYVIANKGIDMQILKENSADDNLLTAPSYRDTATSDGYTPLPYDRIRYFPGTVAPNFVLVGGLNLSEANKPMQVSSYVGAGDNIYANEDHLYVAVTQYKQVTQPMNDVAAANSKMMPQSVETNTLIYKFALDQGAVRSIASGTVPGTIIGQFAMDEHAGYFRIATTNGNIFRTDEQTSKNNVYVLDGTMNRSGQLEGLAPGERIYSIRFMGDRAYMVTFKKVDPLFVIDLKDPKAPVVLGKLKIPGYSDYLHPYDENHIIGFGKDAVEAANEWDPKGSTTAFYQGMKIAMFDVSDVTHPIEMFKESIGVRGTDSELLHNHKALLFSKEKGLLAFPVTVMENKAAAGASRVMDYGQFTFQGLYVYHVDLTKGFQLQGKITHLSQADLDKAGSGWYQGDFNVQRGMYIDNVLYSVSSGMIKANELGSLKELSLLKLTP